MLRSLTTAATGMDAQQTRLDVTRGNIQPFPIAIPDFVAGTANEADTPQNISGIDHGGRLFGATGRLGDANQR